MIAYFLKFTLKSDAIFGKGDDFAGVVDVEVQQDQLGCPYLGGRAIKGILVNECADILAALSNTSSAERWRNAARSLFGVPGSTENSNGILSVGNAHLPEEFRKLLCISLDRGEEDIAPYQIFDALTSIRHLTAIEEDGVAKDKSLRTVRVVVRNTPFEARLLFQRKPEDDQLALLFACVKAFRRVGTNRNRGYGFLEKVELINDEGNKTLDDLFNKFTEGVK